MQARDKYPGQTAWGGQGAVAGLVLQGGYTKGVELYGDGYGFVALKDADGNDWLVLIANPDGSATIDPKAWLDGHRQEDLIAEYRRICQVNLERLGLATGDPAQDGATVYYDRGDWFPQGADGQADRSRLLRLDASSPLPRSAADRAADPRFAPYVEGVRTSLRLTQQHMFELVLLCNTRTRIAVPVGFANLQQAQDDWDGDLWSNVGWQLLDLLTVALGVVLLVTGAGTVAGVGLIIAGVGDSMRRWYNLEESMQQRDADLKSTLATIAAQGHHAGGAFDPAGAPPPAAGSRAKLPPANFNPYAIDPATAARNDPRLDLVQVAAQQVDAATLQRWKDQQNAKGEQRSLLLVALAVAWAVLG